MRQTLFKVWYKSGFMRCVYANGPLEAFIKAQASAIDDGLNYEVSSLQDEETGHIFKVEQPAILTRQISPNDLTQNCQALAAQ